MDNFNDVGNGDDSDFEDADDQLIIINQQNADDGKKIIYMSNINSCSLPLTPKDGSSSNNVHLEKERVFEYKVKANVYQNKENKDSRNTFKRDKNFSSQSQ